MIKMISHKVVPVIIPHFNAPEALKLTISRIEQQAGVQTSIFVRDNSQDNILFTRAINEGLRRYAYSNEYDYVLVLNQDALLHPECISQMLSVMVASPQIGICAPIALSKDQSVNWAGSAEAFPWGRHVSYNLTQIPKVPFETHWINGACMLLRTAMVREIGLLDENMRFICSDADYSFTTRARGWRCYVIPSAFVNHEPGGSSNTTNAWLNQIKYEDQAYFAKKWLTGDLYREISFEGHKLSHESIQTYLEEVRLMHLNSRPGDSR